MEEEYKKIHSGLLKKKYKIKDEKTLFYKLIRKRLKELHEARK